MKPNSTRGYGMRYVLFAALLLDGLVLGLTLLSAPTSRLEARFLIRRAETLIGEMGKDAEHDETLRPMAASLLKQIDKVYVSSATRAEAVVTKLALLGIGNLAIFLGLYIAVRKQTTHRHPAD